MNILMTTLFFILLSLFLSAQPGYRITIAADIPDNDRPDRVYYKKEPGHVFVILEQTDSAGNVSMARVWGFYPVRPVSCILFRNVRCELRDNGSREYDASITKNLSEEEFLFVRRKAEELTAKKYNINRYNCYDYAIEIFNSLPGNTPLPVTHVRFPFIFGKGGSPCGLYKDLKKLKESDAAMSSLIQIGHFYAPPVCSSLQASSAH